MNQTNQRPKRKRYFGMTAGQVAALAAMSAFVCVVLGVGVALLLDSPSQSSQANQKIYPTVAFHYTPWLTDTPEPTKTPQPPTRTPRPPTKQPVSVTSGLGVSTSLVKATMEDRGYVFESAKPVAGHERWMGRSQNGKGFAVVDLRGSPNVVGMQHFFVISDDLDLMRQVGKDAGVLIGTLLPNWSDASQWMSAHVQDVVLTGKEANTSNNGVPIRVSRTGDDSLGYFLAITIGDIP